MKTPLEVWQALPEYQEAAEKFFESNAGHAFILAMQQFNLPNTALAQENQAGFQRFINKLPDLFLSTSKKIETAQSAQDRLNKQNQFRTTNP